MLGIAVLSGCSAGAPTPVPSPTHVTLETFPPGEPSGNGVEHLSGADVLSESIAAIDDQPGMQFTVTYADAAGSSRVTFTGRVGAAHTTVETSSGTLDLVLGPASGTASGTGDLAARYGLGPSPVCRPASDAVFVDRLATLDPGMLLRTLTAGVTLRRGGVSTGTPPTLDIVLDGESGTVGTLVVAATGDPLPIRLVIADETASAVLDVTGWSASDVEPPTGC
jgi:hypothetical protein